MTILSMEVRSQMGFTRDDMSDRMMKMKDEISEVMDMKEIGAWWNTA